MTDKQVNAEDKCVIANAVKINHFVSCPYLEGELPHVGQTLVVLTKPTMDDDAVVAALSLDHISIKPTTGVRSTIAAIGV